MPEQSMNTLLVAEDLMLSTVVLILNLPGQKENLNCGPQIGPFLFLFNVKVLQINQGCKECTTQNVLKYRKPCGFGTIDRYRITQEKFKYHGVEICRTFWAYTLYQITLAHLIKGIYLKIHTYFYSVVLELFLCYTISIRQYPPYTPAFLHGSCSTLYSAKCRYYRNATDSDGRKGSLLLTSTVV